MICSQSANVYNAVSIGQIQMKDFEEQLPGDFYIAIKKVMDCNRKDLNISGVEVFNTEVIYARVKALISIGNVDLEDVASCFLLPPLLSSNKKEF